MPRPRKSTPTYSFHKSSGQARATWTDPTGHRHERWLPGPYDSPQSREAFARLLMELAVNPVATPTKFTGGPTVAQILLPYLRHAQAYYPHGSEFETIKDALKPVRELYGMKPAAEFGPLSLKAVREAMIRLGWNRTYINRQVGRVVRCFKWAAAEELIPTTVFSGLKTLAALRAGKTTAREAEPRLPADPAAVVAALPFLPPHVRAVVELLRISGMRPSEACRMTLSQIDRTKAVWVYTMTKHKTAHRGMHRVVIFGPAAQVVIAAYLDGRDLDPDDPLFSPRRQREERYAAMRATRKSKVQPSQVSRMKAETAKRLPGEWFKPEAVCHAVLKACKKAGVAKFSPYQLRHLRGAELREKFSLEHVRAALGHSHASMSAHYARGADAVLATEVAATAG